MDSHSETECSESVFNKLMLKLTIKNNISLNIFSKREEIKFLLKSLVGTWGCLEKKIWFFLDRIVWIKVDSSELAIAIQTKLYVR